MQLKKRLLQKELDHFNRLSDEGKRFFLALFLCNLINPVLSIYTNAFIWRQSHDIFIVGLFNIAAYSLTALGFVANGYFLRRSNPARAFFTGILMLAICVSAIIFFPHINAVYASIFGCFYGFSNGFFWANRNLIQFLVTKRENRMYFASLDSTSTIISNIIVPVLIGALIIFGSDHKFYTPHQAYYAISIFTLLVISGVWFIIKDVRCKLPHISEIFLKKRSSTWQKVDLYYGIWGLLQGFVSFYPTLLVLLFVGNEDAVGKVQSMSAVIGAIVTYSMAKKISPDKRIWVITASLSFYVLGFITFSTLYSPRGVMLFYALIAIAQPLWTIGSTSVYNESIQEENKKRPNHYPYFVDVDIFINAGRVLGIIFFLYLLTVSREFTVRYVLLFLSIPQIFLPFIIRELDRRYHAQEPDSQLELAQSQVPSK